MHRAIKFDINCDFGEGEPRSRTRALMRWVTSANVACGGHAGSVESMDACTALAREFRVRLGAHPGLADPAHFGRRTIPITGGELTALLVHQIGALTTVAAARGVRLHHVKLHGALYHATEDQAPLRRAYLDAVQQWWPRVILYALAGGNVARDARRRGLKVWDEAFLDRGYRPDGALVDRGKPGALIESARDVAERLRRHATDGRVQCIDGTQLPLPVATWCIHGDSVHAPAFARAARRFLDGTAPGSMPESSLRKR